MKIFDKRLKIFKAPKPFTGLTRINHYDQNTHVHASSRFWSSSNKHFEQWTLTRGVIIQLNDLYP